MKNRHIEILFVTKNKNLQKRFIALFSGPQYRFTWLDNLNQVIKYFQKTTYDLLIISDDVCTVDSIHYRDLLAIISKESPQTQILFLVEENEISVALEAMEDANYRYIRIPAPDEEIRLMVELSISRKPDYGRNKLLTKDESIYRFEGFIGGSPPMQKVYRQIRQIASTNIPVLLLGETGTGKDLAARAIHQLSLKKDGHYTPLNLGAFPSELIASELFGHEKGSFTGATQQHKGAFEIASDGTVFLDEIESISNKIQVTLLRLIEAKKFMRLGGGQPISTDARIIAASNENLEELVKQGHFREDLFFRLDVFRIVLPPLRERISDIALIAEDLIAYFNYELNKNIIRIKPECMTDLQDYDWPGNVRELKNVIQRAVLICDKDEISEKHLPDRLQRRSGDSSKIVIEIGKSLDEVEKHLIQKTLSHTKNNRTEAAELLGITRRALYNKLHKHNIR